MNILIDQKIPFLASWLQGNVIACAAEEILPAKVREADALIVRTVTRVDAALLAQSNVRFVGSVSAGHDHLDTAWLKQAGIQWAYAPGANAAAVADYVLACAAWLYQQQKITWPLQVGIIGVGNVGSEVAKRFAMLNCPVLLNDPPRAIQDLNFHSVPLEKILQTDFICVHTPLTYQGDHPTFHLLNRHRLQKIKAGTVLLNAARGAVIDNAALCEQKSLITCLDVWENEPNINLNLLRQVAIGTPHIAGYSKASKYRAAFSIYEKLCEFFNKPKIKITTGMTNYFDTINHNYYWHNEVLKTYNPAHDYHKFLNAVQAVANPQLIFESLRKNYKLRQEIVFEI